VPPPGAPRRTVSPSTRHAMAGPPAVVAFRDALERAAG